VEMGIEERADDILSERLEEIAKLCLSASELLFLLRWFQNLERT